MLNRISFLNDQFLPHDKCLVHIEDRGFQFADGVYEVILFRNNKLIDCEEHLNRLFRSLNSLEIQISKSKEELRNIALQLFAKNNLADGSFYLQITRGVYPRSPLISKEFSPTISATVSALKEMNLSPESGIKTITYPDIRWARCDIKSISLIAGSIAKQRAVDAGAEDAILIRDGFVTEGSFSNVFIVDAENNLVTRNADNHILQGITRDRIIDLAKKAGIKILEKSFSKQELLQAREVFLTSSTLMVRPVFEIDGQKISNGKTGEITKKLITLYNQYLGQ